MRETRLLLLLLLLLLLAIAGLSEFGRIEMQI
jgi:hypothetical protein